MSAQPRPVYLAPEWRLQDLRAAKIVNLPTPRRRVTSVGTAVFCAFGVFLGILAAITERPVLGVAAVLFALRLWVQLAEAREITAQLRAPRTASRASLGEPSSSGDELVTGAAGLVMSGGAGLLDAGSGIAVRVIDRFLRWRGHRKLARYRAKTPLPPGERNIVTCRATRRLHGPWRLVLPLTLYIAGVFLWLPGWLTITDRRLRFRGLSVPLEEVEVVEWFKGSFGEAREHVLVLRAGGHTLRLGIDQIWAEEAQWVFDLLASRSARPPAFLAARWSLHP
jgi:hypothetical protein